MQRYNISTVEYKVLPQDYYLQNDVVGLAKDLLGKVLISDIGGIKTAGIITETEAYSYTEKGCHAYGKKKTRRNAVMFEEGGLAYVYLCYGIHRLFNIVTNIQDEPEAVLIRGIIPLQGMEEMLKRRGRSRAGKDDFSGPGKVTQALGIRLSDDASSLVTGKIQVCDAGITTETGNIQALKRVGIEYAGEDALLLWRFLIKEPDLTFSRKNWHEY